jgi:hypothetical protein
MAFFPTHGFELPLEYMLSEEFECFSGQTKSFQHTFPAFPAATALCQITLSWCMDDTNSPYWAPRDFFGSFLNMTVDGLPVDISSQTSIMTNGLTEIDGVYFTNACAAQWVFNIFVLG